jgi:chloride channel protein, CIC family
VTDRPRALTSRSHHEGNGAVHFSGRPEVPGRARVPAPLISRRLPSGRGAIEQPNATGDGDAELTPKFWLMVGLTGVAAGLFGDLMMLILFTVQHVAFGYHSGSLDSAVEHASDTRRLGVLLFAGVFGSLAWYLLRRHTGGERSDIDDVVWTDDARLSFRRSLGTSVIAEIVIGMGASLGRENAPKLMGGASASVLAGWARLSPAQRRLLMACGAGAGLAAVYNVPLGGALFTAEIMLGTITVPVVLPALACSWIATAVAWLYLPDRAAYVGLPSYRFTVPLLIWALVAGPLIGLLASGYIRLIGWVSYHQASGRVALVAPLLAFGVLGLMAFAYPQLLGNGKDMAHDAFIGAASLPLLLALVALKPLVTAMCLGSGASGGLFTPTLSTGAVLGGALGILWSLAWPGSPAGAYALVGATAMLGAAMQAPLAALALTLELTQGQFQLMIPVIAATVAAVAIARRIDGYSIYTARLRAYPGTSAPPPGAVSGSDAGPGGDYDRSKRHPGGAQPQARAHPAGRRAGRGHDESAAGLGGALLPHLLHPGRRRPRQADPGGH